MRIEQPPIILRLCPEDWYKILDSKKFTSSRLFLGYTPRSYVKNGRDRRLASNILESGAYESSSSRWERLVVANIGIGYKRLTNLALSVSGIYATVSSEISVIKEQ